MEFNILMLAAYLLRVLRKILNENIPFSWYEDEGRKNIKITIFNGLIVLLVYWLSFYRPLGPYEDVGYYMICYFVIGWFIDSFLMAVIKFGSQLLEQLGWKEG